MQNRRASLHVCSKAEALECEQVKKLDGHVVEQRSKLDAAQRDANTAAEAHGKLQMQLSSLGSELAKQRSINRQLKTDHMAQMAELAATQNRNAGGLDHTQTQQVSSARRTAAASMITVANETLI